MIAGFYKVSAAKPGCANPNNLADPTVSTGVLPVPPPVTDLKLTLNCDPLSGLHARALRNGKIKVTFIATGAGRVRGKASPGSSKRQEKKRA